jgi:FAD dependent oxidoreductase TIGR03364
VTEHYDAAVVGGGILGLAHAYHLARRGLRVVVFERHPRCQGASVRNFGMLWPIGQPAGEMYRLARRSLEIWTEILRETGLWHERTGSLHLAYHDDEAQVLREFVGSVGWVERSCELLTAAEIADRFPAVQPDGLLAGMWSPTETTIDPRDAVAELPAWLSRAHCVRFEFGMPVVGYERPTVWTSAGTRTADRLVVCSGDELQTLFPEELATLGLTRCKLQMMRTQPVTPGWRLGPMLAAGLTLQHYPAFAGCPTLFALKRRLAQEMPDYVRYGIHVMAAQNGRGELVLGDSHEYGGRVDIFDKPEIDDLVLAYLRTFLAVTDFRIAARWHGIYVKHPDRPWRSLCPADGVTLVTAVGGAGMTLSFGVAEQVVEEILR